MFKSLKQKLESEKIETSSLSSEGDVNQSNRSSQQFDGPLLENCKHKSNSYSEEQEDRRINKAVENVSKWRITSSSSSQDISYNNHNHESNHLPDFSSSPSSFTLVRPISMSSVNDTISSKPAVAADQLKWENNRLREQVQELSRKLEAATNEKQVDYIDEKLLKLVGESIVKEASGASREYNGVKSTSGNWSSLLSSSANTKSNLTVDHDLHKQEIEKLQARINELEESLREKNKTIRLQQQRINDIRKSFQRGSTLDSKLFDLPGNQNDGELSTSDTSTFKTLPSSRSENDFTDQQQQQQQQQQSQLQHHQRQLSDSQASPNCPMNDISWQYLRSVIFKFVLTSDYEAQKHLVKAISMLLQFSDAEEKQIREGLEQKVSWFKNLPLLGNGFKMNQHNQHNSSNHH